MTRTVAAHTALSQNHAYQSAPRSQPSSSESITGAKGTKADNRNFASTRSDLVNPAKRSPTVLRSVI